MLLHRNRIGKDNRIVSSYFYTYNLSFVISSNEVSDKRDLSDGNYRFSTLKLSYITHKCHYKAQNITPKNQTKYVAESALKRRIFSPWLLSPHLEVRMTQNGWPRGTPALPHNAVGRDSKWPRPERLQFWQDCGIKDLPYGHYQARNSHPEQSLKHKSLSSLIGCQNRTHLDCTKNLTEPVLLLTLTSIIAEKKRIYLLSGTAPPCKAMCWHNLIL